MLIATPDTTWSTPNVTVATACSSPPSAPPMIPHSTPAHGPHCQPPHAPNQVPRIIMPFETDVHDARALRVETTERGQTDRHREAHRGAERAARRQVVRAGDRPAPSEHREDAEGDEQRCRATTSWGSAGDARAGPSAGSRAAVLMPAPARDRATGTTCGGPRLGFRGGITHLGRDAMPAARSRTR